ncbi:hypothetical protein C2857_002721 [Epichloe festucae Fl1]|uniref:DUF7820 domain-containing protein n=1 Tax=Epichloe festucae (strain Fl1) TaxID=877507 RepID=A0A7U3Q1C8_EPIFF|nr:hypothetical protein C2857_002721 [Epichloe festucae Fl1]
MPPNDGNSESEKRRSSTAENLAQQSGDDYDLIANTVSDGFRPSASTRPSETPSSFPSPSRSDPSQFSGLPRSPPLAAAPPPKGLNDFNRPSSISKAPRAHDSLILRNDGLTSPRNGQSSSSGSTTQIDAQYQGAAEPSHPYQMYPQRTYSNATSSTEPLSSVETYDGPRGPTHPYALYTQNTATPEDTTQRLIPVGFNGMGSGYRRQLGPDGEEAGDLIGPLGHTEELPPYTRYPHEPFAAKSATEIEVATPINPDVSATRNVGLTVSSSPGHPIPGAGGIGLATRNPEFSSTEDDLLSPPHRPGSSLRSVPSVECYHHVNEAAQEYAEKSTQGKWQRRAKKKLWGIVPYWAMCLLLSGIVIMGVVMGTVIGTIVTRQREPPPVKDQPTGQKPLSNNVQYLLERPPSLPPLDTGCYALPSMEKYQVPKACIKDSSQSPAWSCDMPFRRYSMNVTPLQDATDTPNYALKLAPFDPKAPKYIWGSQPPDIPEFQRLSLVKDLEERNRGAAWYLEVEYNKTVILRGDQLHATSSSSPRPTPAPTGAGAAKRHWGPLTSPVPGYDRPRIMRKGSAATDGDNPWICTWPNIKLQVFIYPNQTVAPTKTTTSAGPVSTGSSDPPAPSNCKEPYTKLVKFVERRLESSPAATCTQYKIINDGRDKLPNLDDNGNPITIKINEFFKGTRGIVTDGLASSSSWDVSSLQERDVDLTPCGCVFFSWSV